MYVIDRASSLGKLEQTPQGGYRAPATVARTGVLKYMTGDGREIRIYTPKEVIEAALDSLRDAPVTNEHPKKMVDPASYREVAAGTVRADSVSFDGQYLKAQLVIQDGKLLSDIDSGVRREVSAGYWCDVAHEPGESPDGEAYDAIRTKITYNHVAVVKKARAGSKVCLALDSEEIPFQDEVDNVSFKIKGAEVPADKAQAAFDSYTVELRTELDSATAERDVLKAKLADVEKKLAEATSDSAIDARVEEKLKAKAEAEARAKRVEAVKAAGFSVDGKSEAYVDALYDLVEKQKADDPDGIKKLKGEVKSPVADSADKSANADKPAKKAPDPKALQRKRNAQMYLNPKSE